MLMAVLTRLPVDAYLRLCDALALGVNQLLPPAVGVSQHWAPLVQPSTAGEAGKTRESDDTVSLDSPHLQWRRPVLETLHNQDPEAHHFPSRYAAYMVEFKKT